MNTPQTYTGQQAANILQVDISRIYALCRSGRLGYTVPRHGCSWIITADEIAEYQRRGPRPPGRPRKHDSA